MIKPTIIPNWKYQKPTKGGYKGLKKLLKYARIEKVPTIDHWKQKSGGRTAAWVVHGKMSTRTLVLWRDPTCWHITR